jgi:general stress protein 26
VSRKAPDAGPAAIVFDEVDQLYELIEEIETAVMTTRRRDGSLVSRPVATERRADGAHFWFVGQESSSALAEIVADPNVNLTYYRDRNREWVSVSGVARVVRDRTKIRELYEPTWKALFPDDGGARDGGPEDPRIVLIAVEARAAHLMRVDRPSPVVLFDDYLRLRRRARDLRSEVGRMRTPLSGDALDA